MLLYQNLLFDVIDAHPLQNINSTIATYVFRSSFQDKTRDPSLRFVMQQLPATLIDEITEQR